MSKEPQTQQLSRNVKRLSHLDLTGAGQVYVNGNYPPAANASPIKGM